MSLGVGIIGAGVMGADHARTLACGVAGAHIAAISDADAERARAIAAETGARRVEANAYALISHPSVQAVLVASPDHTHKDFVLACLELGKPVLCEKPLAPLPEDCLRVVEHETSLGQRLVQVGFMRRFDPAYGAMKGSLENGRLGRPLLFHAVHRNPTAPSFFEDGMIITNAAVHEVDVARWLLGCEIVRARVVRPPSSSAMTDRELLLVVLENAAGSLVDIEVFMSAGYGYDIRGEVVCEQGTVEMAPPGLAHLRYAGTEAFPFPMDWRGRFADAYRRQLQAWVDSVARGKPCGASAWDGYAATAVAAACLESLRTGQPADVHMNGRPTLYDCAARPGWSQGP